MQSEFYNVELDRIRYSLVWEDSRTLYDTLDITPADHVLVITSAGCNVLNTLLRGPRHVTATDLNPAQNQLLRFKRHLILYHDHQVLRGLLGFDGPAGVAAAWRHLAPRLPLRLRDYWTPFFVAHPSGILTSGKLESYITGFLPTLDPATQASLRRLVQCASVAEQRAFFADYLHGTRFQAQFIAYFDEANLSKGRDPRLFRYATETGGQAFYQRLCQAVGSQLLRDNFFFRFFFFGPTNLPEAILPPCYQQRHFAALRQQLPHLTIRTGEAAGYLLTPEGADITKASLSNIFEYVSPEEFGRVGRALFAHRARPLRLVFWNLLQDQGADPADELPLLPEATAALSRQPACFYFRNVRVLDSCRHLIALPA
ncbi:DUF3419 family protein [Hymenobacter algoricola]|uniref:DUF3419 family protein n=1 Tax=Hymenobacter algoricola TaxID=486267 RepID=A0ABP7MZ67_9BACT